MSTSDIQEPKRVVIVGAGVSGSLVAVHLIREARCSLEITLIEKSPPFGRGVAYGTEVDHHLLNVRAGNMSLFEDRPEDFLNWVKERVGRSRFPKSVEAGDFLPRRLLGEYSYHVLQKARQEAGPHIKVNFVQGEVVDLEERSTGYRVLMADGTRFPADKVVLALGNLPGEYPIRRSLKFYHSRRYVHVPWKPDVLDGINKDDDVLIVGAGLTSVDVVVQLAHNGHRGRIYSLSRRGQRPKVHKVEPSYAERIKGRAFPTTVLGAFRWLREEVEKAGAEGFGWRAVLDALRPHTPDIWLSWSWEERARFMRHVRPFWDNHRHRLAPATANELDRLLSSGQLVYFAGRLESLTEVENGVDAVFRLKRTQERRAIKVGKVINCTGPRSDYSKYQHPLFINLLARGLIDHDPLALGLRATKEGEVYRYRGEPTGGIFTLGTPLKSALWECTAVPEIRIQARKLALKIASSLA